MIAADGPLAHSRPDRMLVDKSSKNHYKLIRGDCHVKQRVLIVKQM